VIKKLKPEMTCDPDGYSPFLVKQLVSAFADPLTLLFSSFLSIGMEESYYHSYFQKGVSSNPANWRPVSLTSVFG